MSGFDLIGFAKNNSILIDDKDCSGYPYLKLMPNDYNIEAYLSAYSSLIDLVKSTSIDQKFSTDKTHLFDIHPVFSNGILIPSMLGFHLSLKLLTSGEVDQYENLYFDTATNWRKFTMNFNRAYQLATWQKIKTKDIYEINDSNNDDIFSYVKTSILLYNAGELLTTDLKAQKVNADKLYVFYKKNNIKDIVLSEIDLIKIGLDIYFENNDEDVRGALYIFLMVFFWEFSLSFELFNDLVVSLNLKYSIQDDSHILSALFFSFTHCHELKIKAGYYVNIDSAGLDLSQIDVSVYSEISYANTEKSIEDGLIFTDSIEDTLNRIKSFDNDSLITNKEKKITIIESKRKSVIKPKIYFYDEKLAMDISDVQSFLFKKSKEYIYSFTGKNITNEKYNIMRGYLDILIAEVMREKNNFINFRNLSFQLNAINSCAFNIYQKSHHSYLLRIGSRSSLDSLELKLPEPVLDQDTKEKIKYMNTAEKKLYIKNSIEKSRLDLLSLVSVLSAKISHSSHLHKLGNIVNGVDKINLLKMIEDWYISNYVAVYLEIFDSYENIVNRIQDDISNFDKIENSNQDSLFFEVNNFIRSKRNPISLLQLSN